MTKFSGGLTKLRQRLEQYPGITFLLPLLVFLLVGTLETTDPTGSTFFGLIHYEDYPLVYSAKILLTTLSLILIWPAYRVFPFRVNLLAIGVGVVGVVLWVGLVHLGLEQLLPLDWITGKGERVAYNPVEALGHRTTLMYVFLAIRFFGLAIVIAIAEEMFLRGLLIRYIENPDRWNTLPIGQAGWPALIAGTVVPMLMHPSELFAALMWFSLISWLMLQTRNIWDCITAHMITNLLLGIYVLISGHWHLW